MAFNVALLADDAMDAYLQYNAANRRLASERKRKQGLPKQADYLEDQMFNAMVDPRSVLPSALTLGLSAAGVVASAYAPDWAGGPGEGEARLDPKRAMKAIVSYNVLGNAIHAIPGAIATLQSDASVLSKINHATKIVPPIVLASSLTIPLVQGKRPVAADVMRNFRRASMVSTAGKFLKPEVVSSIQGIGAQIMEEARR